jgi:hypothetical protein
MQVKTFLGKIEVTIGEYSNSVSLLVVANSDTAAWAVLHDAAKSYYGSEDDEEDSSEVTETPSGYSANGGELMVSPATLNPIGLSTFLDLKKFMMVRRQENVTVPEASSLESDLGLAAKQFANALDSRGVKVGHNQMLEALSAAWGHKTWQVLKAKSNLSCRVQLAKLRELAQLVVNSEDDTGCTEDLTVASKEAIDNLSEYLEVVERVLEEAFPAGPNSLEHKLALTDSLISLSVARRATVIAALVADKESDVFNNKEARVSFCATGFEGFENMTDADLLQCAVDAGITIEDL